jgi:hypothetical protein
MTIHPIQRIEKSLGSVDKFGRDGMTGIGWEAVIPVPSALEHPSGRLQNDISNEEGDASGDIGVVTAHPGTLRSHL